MIARFLNRFIAIALILSPSLPAAQALKDHVDGDISANCLIHNAYHYQNEKSSHLAKAMGRGIQSLIPKIKDAIENYQYVSVNTVKDWLGELAEIRKAVAKDSGSLEPYKYGLWLPESESDMKEFLSKAKINGDYSYDTFRTTDVIGRPDNLKDQMSESNSLIPFFEGLRHSYLYPRALYIFHKWQKLAPPNLYHALPYRAQLQLVSIDSAEKQANYIFVVHPTLKEMTALRREAYLILVDLIINDYKLGEVEKLQRFDHAYLLLMHAMPFYRGTPAIIEAFKDAYLRASLKKCLGHKLREPFWEAIFWDESPRDFTSAFLNSFR